MEKLTRLNGEAKYRILDAFREVDLQPRSLGAIARHVGLSEEETELVLKRHPEYYRPASYRLANQVIYELTERGKNFVLSLELDRE